MACWVCIALYKCFEILWSHHSQLRELLATKLGDKELMEVAEVTQTTCCRLCTNIPICFHCHSQGIKKCRDDEMEHLDTGIEHHAEQVCNLYY